LNTAKKRRAPKKLRASERRTIEAALRELAEAAAENYPGRPAMVGHMLRKLIHRVADDCSYYRLDGGGGAVSVEHPPYPASDARHARQVAAMRAARDAMEDALGNDPTDRVDAEVYAFAEGLIAEIERPAPRVAPEPEPSGPTATAILPDEEREIRAAVANLRNIVASAERRDPRAFVRFLVLSAHRDAVQAASAEHAAMRDVGPFRRIQAARDEVWSAIEEAVGWHSTKSAEAPGGWIHGSAEHDRDVARFVLGLLGLPESYIVPAE
jgi:hypothetical protein